MVRVIGNLREGTLYQATTISGATVTGTTGQFAGTISAQRGEFSTGLTVSGVPVQLAGGGGSGTPGGTDTQVQFNDAGSFGGDSGLTYNKTTDTLTTITVTGTTGQFGGTVSAQRGEFSTGLTVSGTPVSLGGSGTPGGSTTQVQFNDAGSFGGDTGLTYSKSTDTLTAGKITLATTFPDAAATVISRNYGFVNTHLEISIADDTAFRLDNISSGSMIFILTAPGLVGSASWSGIIIGQAGIGSSTFAGGANFNHLAVSDTPLSGSGGTDARLNIQWNASGTVESVWMNNRAGGTIYLRFFLLSGNLPGLAATITQI